MPNVILNENAQKEISDILNQLPISHLAQAQKIFQLIQSNVEQTNESQPPIGGGGGSAKPPKKNE